MLEKYYLIIKKLLFIFSVNPIFFFKRIFFELKYLILPTPQSVVSKKINGISFEFDFNLSPQMKRMYVGAYQPIITEILKKYLKNGDTFIDVGANIGFFTAIAAGIVGKQGQVHSFEPVLEHFYKLKNLAENNSQYNITANQFALGDKEKISKIYGNTFIPALLGEDDKYMTLEVSIRRLDKYIQEKGLNNIKLIKIDVEGFEFPVLKGMEEYFLECSKNGSCPAIVCEVFPGIGYEVKDLFKYMRSFSYYPFEVLNSHKRIVTEKKRVDDVLFKFCK